MANTHEAINKKHSQMTKHHFFVSVFILLIFKVQCKEFIDQLFLHEISFCYNF
jgi:hypothetical protein